jgi:hypothetical protein
MRQFSLSSFYIGILRLRRYIRELGEFTDEPESRLVHSEQLKQLKHDGAQVALSLDMLRLSEMPNVVSCLQVFSGTLPNLTREQMVLQARQFEHSIQIDSPRVALAVLRRDQDAAILDLAQITGLSFPEAVTDAAFAGDCYRIEAFDACVFHLLRVLERGLRKMAGELRVPSYHAGQIELCNWGTLIDEIGKAIKALPGSTPQAREYRERLSSAAVHFWFVKDVWRNVYYHVRNPPTTQEKASQFLVMTKDLMNSLRK